MKITELVKIIKQIQKYQLWNEIKNVRKWIKGLTNKEIDNFIKLDVELTKPIIEYKYLLISLLNSDYYLQDMESLSKAKTDKIAYNLRLVAWDPISLYSGYHTTDMEQIANAKDDAEAEERYQTIMNKYKTPDKRQLTNEEKKDIIKYVDNDESKEISTETFTKKNLKKGYFFM